MGLSLLATKLYVPVTRPELVRRPRLIEQLNAGLRCKLTVVSAPAGFGKTTLLAEWVQACGTPVAWVSLDEQENDPACFLAYLVAALEGIGAEIDLDAAGALVAPQSVPTESSLTSLINKLAAIPHAFVLTLDDYHVIKSQAIHSTLTFLLEHLPAQMHVVIATRADPPLPIARLRGQGQLVELRQSDLRFTADEAAAFLNQVMGLGLSADDVAALALRTEGWIAGLQMAALAIQSHRPAQGAVRMPGTSNATSFIQALTGSDRYILDYLVEEVLQRQPEGIQAFLLRTAILERLTGSLCDAMLEAEDWVWADGEPAQAPYATPRSQAILEHLEASNLFIVPLDNERRWYRYHRLFADLLRQRLQQFHPELVPALHRRASEWHEQNGFQAAAIDHALSAKDFIRAGQMIEQAAEATLMRSEVLTFVGWMETLPDTWVRRRPSLCILHAWALLLSGEPIQAVEARLEDMDKDIELDPGTLAPLQAYLATFRGQIPRAAELSQQALESLPENDRFLRSIATWNLAISSMLSGDMGSGSQGLDEVVRLGQAIGNTMITVMALCNLAEMEMAQMQLHRAKEIYERALGMATDRAGRRLPIAGMALLGLGELAREWNDFETADAYLSEGIARVRQWGEIGAMDGYVSLARLRQAQGDAEGSLKIIQEARLLAEKFDATDLDDFIVAAQEVRLWLAQGKIEAAARWLEAHGVKLDDGSAIWEEGDSFYAYHMRRYEYILLARTLLAQDRPGSALTLLEELITTMELRGSSRRRLTEVRILKALALQAEADVDQALTILQEVLALAEPAGHVRTFADEGEPMARLLRQAASHRIMPVYANKLLAAFDGVKHDDEADMVRSQAAQALIDPLSARELEVLRLLAAGLSNPEIARELYIATSTVRSHVKNIFGKLNVHKRWDAVQRAEELALL